VFPDTKNVSRHLLLRSERCHTVMAARVREDVPPNGSINHPFPSPPWPYGAAVRLSATGAGFFREMKHGVPQQPIRFGLITATISFEQAMTSESRPIVTGLFLRR
jgi:hypothetical protein